LIIQPISIHEYEEHQIHRQTYGECETGGCKHFYSHTAKECRVYARFSEQEPSISDAFEMSLVGVRLVVGRE
jgi:hypothetical protein